jgi:hypothetical protein
VYRDLDRTRQDPGVKGQDRAAGEGAITTDAVESCAALGDVTGGEARGSESGLEVLGDYGSDVGSRLKKPTSHLVTGRTINLNTDAA